MEDLIFNLDDPEIDSEYDYVGEISRLYWEKYDRFLASVRTNCSATEDLDGFPITSWTFEPPLMNLVFEMTQDEKHIYVTVKCQRATVYFVAIRKGRGDPDPNDPENNAVWRECNDCTVMPKGTQKTGFDANYSQATDSIGIDKLRIPNLRNALYGLYTGRDERKNFITLCIHFAEPVRFDCVVRYFQRNMQLNMLISFDLTSDILTVIKNWGAISLAIQQHLILGTDFHVNEPDLQHLTIETVRHVITLLKDCKVQKPVDNKKKK